MLSWSAVGTSQSSASTCSTAYKRCFVTDHKTASAAASSTTTSRARRTALVARSSDASVGSCTPKPRDEPASTPATSYAGGLPHLPSWQVEEAIERRYRSLALPDGFEAAICNAIQVERRRIEAGLADTGAQLAIGAEQLRTCLELAADVPKLYSAAPEGIRTQLKATFFHRFYLDDAPPTVTSDEMRSPFDEISDASTAYIYYRARTGVYRANGVSGGLH